MEIGEEEEVVEGVEEAAVLENQRDVTKAYWEMVLRMCIA